MNTSRLAIALAVIALAATGCGDDSQTAATGDTTATAGVTSPTAAPAASTAVAVAVSRQWARTSPANAANGAVYMTLRSAEADALVGASVDSAIAGKVEIHETVSADSAKMDASSSTMASKGAEMMSMRPIEKLELPKATDVELKPGGYHVMLLGLPKPLKTGETFELTLTFERAGTSTIVVPVLDAAP